MVVIVVMMVIVAIVVNALVVIVYISEYGLVYEPSQGGLGAAKK